MEHHMELVPVTLPDGAEVKLAVGKHNELQIAIIRQFLPRFAPNGDVPSYPQCRCAGVPGTAPQHHG